MASEKMMIGNCEERGGRKDKLRREQLLRIVIPALRVGVPYPGDLTFSRTGLMPGSLTQVTQNYSGVLLPARAGFSLDEFLTQATLCENPFEPTPGLEI